ncbi:unnamed protein product [Rhodiola kirilowii]
MSATKSSGKKRRSEVEPSKLEKIMKDDDDIFGADISNDIKWIVSVLHQIKEKAHKDGQKKNEETISSVAAEMKLKLDELKSKFEKERQSFVKTLSKSSKECESTLKNETAKFQALYEKFSKEKSAHLQALRDTISKFEEDKEKLLARYDQLRKKEKAMLAEHEKACTDKIGQLEESLKKKKQEDRTFNILRKTLGTFLDNASDDDFPVED